MSDGTKNMEALACAITAMRQQGRTVPDLVEATGAHRHTVSKWLAVLQGMGQVRPRGSRQVGRNVWLLWEWVE